MWMFILSGPTDPLPPLEIELDFVPPVGSIIIKNSISYKVSKLIVDLDISEIHVHVERL